MPWVEARTKSGRIGSNAENDKPKATLLSAFPDVVHQFLAGHLHIGEGIDQGAGAGDRGVQQHPAAIGVDHADRERDRSTAGASGLPEDIIGKIAGDHRVGAEQFADPGGRAGIGHPRLLQGGFLQNFGDLAPFDDGDVRQLGQIGGQDAGDYLAAILSGPQLLHGADGAGSLEFVVEVEDRHFPVPGRLGVPIQGNGRWRTSLSTGGENGQDEQEKKGFHGSSHGLID